MIVHSNTKTPYHGEMNKNMSPTHDIIGAIKHGIAGFIAWASSVGFSLVVFDEWLSRISIIVGILVGILTIISIVRKLVLHK